RPVRIRMKGNPAALLLRGDSMRAWNAGGSLIAMENGDVMVRASGDRIGWGESTLFASPIDVWAPGGLSLSGRRLPGRIRISAQNGGIRVVAVVPLEEYVAAVLSREAAPSFHPEALSALAVAVRTYTLFAIAAPRAPDYDLVAGVDDQVFEGVENIAEGYRKAAEATRGEVLYYRDGLARTVYHSTCGGRTESAAAAWGTDFPYLRSVWCDDCRESPAWRWEYRMSRAEGTRIALDLGVGAGGGLRIEIATRTTTGRARHVRLASAGTAREVKASSFRRAAGYARVKSLCMEIAPSGDGWEFSGKGYGHGVGMCQWGANGMAKRGAGYREILARYYLHTRVASLPGGVVRFAMNLKGAP
ncbi:MAG: SpoIID/LytB domain-containing protein, partial [Candidatus Deferrimicrobiaceae bacterium]